LLSLPAWNPNEKVILDPEARRVAALTVSKGGTLFSEGDETTVPASCIHAIGPDAITVHHGNEGPPLADLDGLPRVSDVIGRKVVSEDGRYLGWVRDVLIDRDDRRIVGYAVGDDNVLDRLGDILKGDRKRETAYLRADAHIRAGRDLIVAPEDAITREWIADAPPPRPGIETPPPAHAPRIRDPRREDAGSPVYWPSEKRSD